MKNFKKLNGLKKLTRNDQKTIVGGYMGQADPNQTPDGECPWNMCKNSHGRCTMMNCPDFGSNQG